MRHLDILLRHSDMFLRHLDEIFGYAHETFGYARIWMSHDWVVLIWLIKWLSKFSSDASLLWDIWICSYLIVPCSYLIVPCSYLIFPWVVLISLIKCSLEFLEMPFLLRHLDILISECLMTKTLWYNWSYDLVNSASMPLFETFVGYAHIWFFPWVVLISVIKWLSKFNIALGAGPRFFKGTPFFVDRLAHFPPFLAYIYRTF